jgi:hypothetical protein
MAGEFVDAPAPAPAPQFVDAPAPTASSVVKGVDNSIGKWAMKNIVKPLGGAIQYGHQHPFDAALNVLTAPQRGLQALETGADVGHSIMTPKEGPKLTKAVKRKIGLQGLEDGPLAGNDLGHKLMRGTLDTGLDIVNDPVTWIPGGFLAKATKLDKPLEAAGKAFKGTKLGQKLDPEAKMAGLTDKGKATFEAITNRAVSNVKAIGDKEEAVIRQHADQIRQGIMPPEVAALFRNPKKIPKVEKGTRPQEVVSALASDRARVMYAQKLRELQSAGLINGRHETGLLNVKLKNPGEFFTDPNKIAGVKKTLTSVADPRRKKGDPNLLLRLAKSATRLGNKAFLANPVPHTLNITDLAYNKYGLPTTLAGLGNAARVATGTVGKGKLAQDIGELENLGVKFEHRNIFDEMGLTGNKYVPGSMTAAKVANRVLIPMQRASNYAQHKILNSTETGLRAAALNAEKKGGKQGVEAARNIHQTFGTGPQSELIKSISDLGTPFAKFHLETAPLSGLRTLATNPGRVSNVIKINRDYNNQVNPHGPEYRNSIPSMSTAKALADPLSYFSNLGPLSQLDNPYGVVEQLKRGPAGVLTVAGDTAGRFIPGSQQVSALKELIEKKRGKLGEKAMNDLIASLVGGYYAKK